MPRTTNAARVCCAQTIAVYSRIATKMTSSISGKVIVKNGTNASYFISFHYARRRQTNYWSDCRCLVGARTFLCCVRLKYHVLHGSYTAQEQEQVDQRANLPSFLSSCCASLRSRSSTTLSKVNFFSTMPLRISSSSMIWIPSLATAKSSV